MLQVIGGKENEEIEKEEIIGLGLVFRY